MRKWRLNLGMGLLLVMLSVTLRGQMDGPRNLGSIVNSKYSDFGPIISADGKSLYFTSDREGGYGGQDGFSSRKSAGEWGAPTSLGQPFNTQLNEGPDCFTPDEQTMYFTGCNREAGLGRCDIWTTSKEGDKWGEPKPLGSSVNTKYNEANASVSSDGKTVFFCSDRPDGLGGWDIWYTTKDEKGNWVEPKNLGPVINTTENEVYVFMHYDGVTLYFSSDGHGGFGNADLFMSKLTANGWSAPMNLGPAINSPEKDFYFTIPGSGDLAYFSSTRSDTLGLEDIYSVPIPALLKPQGLTLVYGIVANIDTCQKFTLDPKLKVKIYDIKSCTPVEAVLRISDSKTDEEKYLGKTKPDGSYKVIIQAGTDYNLNAYAKGFSFHSERFVVPPDAAYKEVEKNILLTPLKVGAVVILHNIYFDFDKAVLRPESKAELANLIRLMNEHPNMNLEIRGHTDNKGSDDYNIRLSKNRAKSVVDYLKEVGGVGGNRLTSIGYSFHLPIASNASDEGRQMNRRVEFKIVSQ